MEITRTINADKRYYIDENLIINSDSLVDTEYRFNDMKIQMYNLLYDKKYKNTGILTENTYSKWCKDTLRPVTITTVQSIRLLPECCHLRMS